MLCTANGLYLCIPLHVVARETTAGRHPLPGTVLGPTQRASSIDGLLTACMDQRVPASRSLTRVGYYKRPSPLHVVAFKATAGGHSLWMPPPEDAKQRSAAQPFAAGLAPWAKDACISNSRWLPCLACSWDHAGMHGITPSSCMNQRSIAAMHSKRRMHAWTHARTSSVWKCAATAPPVHVQAGNAYAHVYP